MLYQSILVYAFTSINELDIKKDKKLYNYNVFFYIQSNYILYIFEIEILSILIVDLHDIN